jgi:predicted nucleotide-binding protein
VHPDDIEDLLAVSRDANDLIHKILDNDFWRQVESINKSVESVHRSWSGSNIGYHASVYYEGLLPKPAHVEFSREWGLMGRWGTHQPDGGWQKMDDAVVRGVILEMSGNPSIEEIKNYFDPIRDELLSLKATATSILSALLAGKTKDAYIQQRLQTAEKIEAALPGAIATKLLPSGRFMSRDSLAMTQGLRVAPHQAVAAEVIAIKVMEQEAIVLRDLSKEVANHIRRLLPRGDRMKKPSTSKGTVFCGHGASPLWRELKDFLRDRLALSVDEFNRVPTAGLPTATRLNEMLDSAAFAFLVFTAEDQQPDGRFRARENVVHEAGLFQGRLGFDRAIVLLEDGCEEFSNIHGLGQIRFPRGRINAIFEEIRRVLEREGIVKA